MAKQLVVTIKFEEKSRKIPVTTAKEDDRGHLVGYSGNDKVADFPLDNVVQWSLEDVA
jgi:hypothetical protein